MTGRTAPRQGHEDLFVADFCPPLGEYLAARHATGYDAAAGRARFRAWLSQQTSQQTSQPASDETSEAMSDPPSDRPGSPSTEPPEIDAALLDYIRKVAQIPGLSLGQEAELAQQIQAGAAARARLADAGDGLAAGERADLEWTAEAGDRARNRLLEANLRLVVSLAKQMADMRSSVEVRAPKS